MKFYYDGNIDLEFDFFLKFDFEFLVMVLEFFIRVFGLFEINEFFVVVLEFFVVLVEVLELYILEILKLVIKIVELLVVFILVILE